MLPYLLGEPHPLGTRLVDSQKCFRSQDIEEVGDNRHDTFWKMLGNWSLGDYFKKEQQAWIWEFPYQRIGTGSHKNYTYQFLKAMIKSPRDEEATDNWKNLGIFPNHTFFITG